MTKQAARRKYHIIYKTTCLVTSKYYIGLHSTDNIDDGYIGSGKRLQYSLKKYGISNHIRETLEQFNDRDVLKEREREIVNEELLKDSLCMNICKGGQAPHINVDPDEFARRSNAQNAIWARPGEKERRSAIQKEAQGKPENRKRLSSSQREAWKSPETRKKHSIAGAAKNADPIFKKEFSTLLKVAHNTPEALKNHSKAKRKLTKEQTFAVLNEHARSKESFRMIARKLQLPPGSVAGVLKALPCYKEWIEIWMKLTTH